MQVVGAVVHTVEHTHHVLQGVAVTEAVVVVAQQRDLMESLEL
jgi:hypothetical protein